MVSNVSKIYLDINPYSNTNINNYDYNMEMDQSSININSNLVDNNRNVNPEIEIVDKNLSGNHNELNTNIEKLNEDIHTNERLNEKSEMTDHLHPSEMTEDDIYQKYITSLMNQKQTEESN